MQSESESAFTEIISIGGGDPVGGGISKTHEIENLIRGGRWMGVRPLAGGGWGYADMSEE